MSEIEKNHKHNYMNTSQVEKKHFLSSIEVEISNVYGYVNVN